MANIIWDQESYRHYDTGVKNLVFAYERSTESPTSGSDAEAKPWVGVTAINESPSGAEETKLYADDDQYFTMYSPESYACTIEAYQFPDAFYKALGVVTNNTAAFEFQPHKRFNIAYITTVGNDVEGIDFGRRLHIVYNLYAKLSAENNSTINDSPEAMTFSFECESLPIAYNGYEDISTITIDEKVLNSEGNWELNPKFTAVMGMVYGTDANTEANPPVAEIRPFIPEPSVLLTNSTNDPAPVEDDTP